MAAHNHDDLMKWKNGLLKNQSNKSSNKKKISRYCYGFSFSRNLCDVLLK